MSSLKYGLEIQNAYQKNSYLPPSCLAPPPSSTSTNPCTITYGAWSAVNYHWILSHITEGSSHHISTSDTIPGASTNSGPTKSLSHLFNAWWRATTNPAPSTHNTVPGMTCKETNNQKTVQPTRYDQTDRGCFPSLQHSLWTSGTPHFPKRQHGTVYPSHCRPHHTSPGSISKTTLLWQTP